MIKLLPLLGKTVEELDLNDLNNIIEVLNLNVTPNEELRLAALQILKGRDIDTVSDLIKSPEAIAELGNFIRGRQAQVPMDEGKLQQCPHCRGFFISKG
jgi:hypothetical protein